jgi:predicted nucleic acid-binding protein
MTAVYAESSAVLSWLLSSNREDEVRSALDSAETVTASDLTLIECDRVLQRSAALGHLSQSDLVERLAAVNHASAGWVVLHITSEVVDRARGTFPEEPIRSPDAIHLASALVLRARLPDLVMLSLDARVRRSARALGLAVLPADSAPQPLSPALSG